MICIWLSFRSSAAPNLSIEKADRTIVAAMARDIKYFTTDYFFAVKEIII
jgi:hypothetical protein